jgi:hypothetical protein
MNDTLTERRDLVTDRLSTEYARGAFEVEELERRLALVQTAKSRAELDALVTDIALADTSTALVPVQNMRVVLGSIERIGPWSVPQNLTARVLFGNLVLDLRDAKLAPGVTTIDVNITMGNLELIVPPGVAVEVDATSFLGHIEERTEPSTRTTDSSVRITGRVKLGNLELATMWRGETHREAKWRRRSARWWRKRGYRRALPPPPWC